MRILRALFSLPLPPHPQTPAACPAPWPHPCLNAIGCGAFKGPYDSVPGLWAAAASDLLRTHAYGFAAVLYSLPDFGDDGGAVAALSDDSSELSDLKCRTKPCSKLRCPRTLAAEFALEPCFVPLRKWTQKMCSLKTRWRKMSEFLFLGEEGLGGFTKRKKQ